MLKYFAAASIATFVALFLALPQLQTHLQLPVDTYFKNRSFFSTMVAASVSRRAVKKVLSIEQEEVSPELTIPVSGTR